MTIASRTPEGFPSRCPLCGQPAEIEFSDPTADAPCPHCGHLLGLSAQVMDAIRRHAAGLVSEYTTPINPDDRIADILGSLGYVELIMELDKEFHIKIADEDAQSIVTVSDLIRYLMWQRRKTDE